MKSACFGLEYRSHVDDFCGKKTIVLNYLFDGAEIKIYLALLMNTCIFLVLKSTLGRGLGTGFTDL